MNMMREEAIHSGSPAHGETSEKAFGSGAWAGVPSQSGSVSGIDMRSLLPGAAFTVDTMNSRYHLVVLDGAPGLAMMQGGELFPEPTRVRIEGSTAGDSELRIGVGLCVECLVWRRRVVTSPVHSITLDA